MTGRKPVGGDGVAEVVGLETQTWYSPGQIPVATHSRLLERPALTRSGGRYLPSRAFSTGWLGFEAAVLPARPGSCQHDSLLEICDLAAPRKAGCDGGGRQLLGGVVDMR